MDRRDALLAAALLAAVLAACSGEKPEPPAPAAAPAEPKIDRLTLLREAQARIEQEREKKRDEMRAIGAATVTKKKKIGKDKDDTKLELEFEFENVSDKDLSVAEGVIEFRGEEGKLLKSLKVPFNQGVKAGKKAQKHGKFPVDPAEEGDVTLVKTPLKDVKVVWVPKRYRFADGTELIGE
jgi:hypothetical protein